MALVQKQSLVAATDRLATLVNRVTEECKKEYAEVGVQQFLLNVPGKGIMKALLPVWSSYHEWLTTVGVKSRTEMELLWKSYEADTRVQKSVQELLTAEKSLTSMLTLVNDGLQAEEDKLTAGRLDVGSPLPRGIKLTELDSGELVALESFWKRSPFTLFILMRNCD